MPIYKNCDIPQQLWDFFESEPGLSTKQLTNTIDQTIVRYPYYFSGFSIFGMIDTFFACSCELIKFYRDHPPLTVEKLLAYNECAMRDFAVHDEAFQFHEFLLENQLTMPEQLVDTHLGSRWGSITTLCDESGIAYLRRKILSLPKAEQQTALDKLVSENDSCKLERDKKSVLADCVAPSNGLFFDTFNTRFVRHSEAIKAKYTAGGPPSLFWLTAQKAASFVTTSEIDAANLPAIVKQAIADAKSLGF